MVQEFFWFQGTNLDVDKNPEDVWPLGGDYPFLSSPQDLEVVSDDSSDTAAGTGAQEVFLFLLDSIGDPVLKTVALNGTTPVAVPDGPYLRLNKAQCGAVGSQGVNDGDIDIRVAGGGTIIGRIPEGSGVSQEAIATIPNKFAGEISSWNGSFKSSDDEAEERDAAFLSLLVRNPGESWRREDEFRVTAEAGHVERLGRILVRLQPLADIRVAAFADRNNGDVVAAVRVILAGPSGPLGLEGPNI